MKYADKFDEFGEYERHLNNVQFVLRGFASTWLLAAAAGFGTVLSKPEIDAWSKPYTEMELVAGISMLASVGIAALWYLDQHVYHRLLNGVFLVGLGIEIADSSALPVRMGMVHRTAGGASDATAWFYRSFLIALAAAVIAVASINNVYEFWHIGWASAISVLLSIALLVFIGAKRKGASGREAVMRGEFGEHMYRFWSDPAARQREIVRRLGRPKSPVRTIVLTGGEYSGKSSLLTFFANAGMVTVKESAIDMLSATDGKELRASSMTEFQARVAVEQNRREEKLPADKLVILDRGLHDGFAYCFQSNSAIPDSLWVNAEHSRYDVVFVLDTLEPFKQRSETGRSGTFEGSVKSGEIINRVYRAFGITTHRVRNFSTDEASNVRQRAAFIVDTLREQHVLVGKFPERLEAAIRTG